MREAWGGGSASAAPTSAAAGTAQSLQQHPLCLEARATAASQPGSGTPGTSTPARTHPAPVSSSTHLPGSQSELSARQCAALSLSTFSFCRASASSKAYSAAVQRAVQKAVSRLSTFNFCRARASSKAYSASPAVQAGGGAVRMLHSQQVASTRSLHPSSATSSAAQSQRRLQHAHQAQRQAHPAQRRCSTAGTAQAARQTQRAQRTLLLVVVVAVRHGHSHQLHLAAAPAGQQGMQGMYLKRLVQQAHQAGRQHQAVE